ncbi:MAG TPA: S8 family serine peptidase, partial [Acidimicrobiia bacterium]|nr:S8 family serine peptidase [Acidimicrobiia bacterium]
QRRLDELEVGALRTAEIGDDLVGYRYRTTLAGFSAQLTEQQAERLRGLASVAAVTADRIRSYPPRPQTVDEQVAADASPEAAAPMATSQVPTASPMATTPGGDLGGQPADYLGLPEGLWARLGGPDSAGDGIVVGVIDSGIYPEHPSFADTPVASDGTVNYIGPAYDAPPATWKGTCEEGENFPATSCNNKLIGARFFNNGFGDRVAEEDFLSPRDADGHGTGVASIAAGNYGVDPQFLGNDLGLDVISGIAPRARVAAYKAVWIVPAFEGSVGSDSDLAAAVDAAVADGVDVLNMSVGVLIDTLGPFSNPSILMDPISLGFLRAFDAGVVAVNSAGNAGPEIAIDHPAIAPWIISAGASGLDTTFGTTVTVSAGPGGPVITAEGITATPGVPELPLIAGTAAAAPGADPALAERCARNTLDPALVQGKIVLCRPQGGAVLTSRNLWELGAAGGLFFTNTRTFRYNPEEYWLPTVILQPADGMAIRDLLASAPGATASFPDGTVTPTTGGDIVLRFSSRGPAFIYPSILKPDLVAPGASIIAAHTPDVPVGGFSIEPPGLFRPLFGTSFSSPVTAGVAALLLDLDPGLGPSEVLSALMTTANPAVLHDANGVPSVPATPLEIGAGRIDPNRAADPGLVLSETTSRFEAFLLTQVPTRDPAQPTVDASDLNRPSIAFDPLIGTRSTERTFTSVDSQPADWQASFTGLAGIEAAVEPPRFSIDPGQSQTLRFTFAPTGLPTGEQYFDGAVVLTNEQDGRTVRLPIVLRPAPFEPPVRLNFGATQPDGQAPFPVPTGYDGVLSVVGYGLAAPQTIRNQTVGKDENSGEDDALAQPGPGVTVFDVQVPPGTQALAAETGGPALTDQLSDIDLFLFYDDEGDGFDYEDLLEFSERDGSAESIIWTDPDPGPYRFAVRGFDADPIATFDLTTWLIADPAPDVLGDPPGLPGLQVTGDPLTAVPGGVANLTVEWSGLDEPGVYLGLIRYDLPIPHPDGLPWETVVAITRGDSS